MTLLEIHPNSWLQLIFFAVIISLLIRIINSFFRSKDSTDSKTFCNIFCGKYDLWLPFFIGVIEIASYSLLIKVKLASYIGGWLAFKTVNRWHYTQKDERGLFNRYLFSNSLVLVASFILAKLLYQ